MTWTSSADAQRYASTILEGDRVRLRQLEERDLPQLAGWWREAEWAVLQQMTVRPQPEQSLTDMFRGWSRNDGSGGVGFSVIDRHSGDLVGHATLYGASLPVRAAFLAIVIGSDHVDRGYGTDAVRLLTGYGFREMGLNRIELRVHAFNDRARAVYAKVGYREEGVRREASFHDGVFHDEVIMAALARDWPIAADPAGGSPTTGDDARIS